jgi:hypothetical protein
MIRLLRDCESIDVGLAEQTVQVFGVVSLLKWRRPLSVNSSANLFVAWNVLELSDRDQSKEWIPQRVVTDGSRWERETLYTVKGDTSIIQVKTQRK